MDTSPQEDSQPSQDSVMTVTDDDRHEILYFAYGSNLSTAQMLQRCPFSTPIGLGHLQGWQWIINERGYANIIQPLRVGASDAASETLLQQQQQQQQAGVYGLLYLLPPRDEELLDGFEGVPRAYQKVHLDVRLVRPRSNSAAAAAAGGEKEDEDGQMVRALVYVDRERTVEGRVEEEYVDRMERGIADAVRQWGLREEYADTVMRRFWRKGPK